MLSGASLFVFAAVGLEFVHNERRRRPTTDDRHTASLMMGCVQLLHHFRDFATLLRIVVGCGGIVVVGGCGRR